VRSEIARTLGPLDRGLTVGLAVGTRLKFHYSVTPLAGLHNGIARPTVVGTAALLHKDALCSYLYSLTNHGDLPPFSMDSIYVKLNGNDHGHSPLKKTQKKVTKNLTGKVSFR